MTKVKNPDEEVTKGIKENFRYNSETGRVCRRNTVEGKDKWSLGDKRSTIRGYRLIYFKSKTYRAHRVAYLLHTGDWPIDQIDHINHVKDDNRWCNLRPASCLENNRNVPLTVNNTSGHKGVYWNKNNNVWMAKIWIGAKDGKWKHLGCFKDYERAVNARQKAERELGFHENHGRTPS